MTSTRFYTTDELNGHALWDGCGGACIATNRDIEPLREQCERLNAEDYAKRRQFGEPRASFIARML